MAKWLTPGNFAFPSAFPCTVLPRYQLPLTNKEHVNMDIYGIQNLRNFNLSPTFVRCTRSEEGAAMERAAEIEFVTKDEATTVEKPFQSLLEAALMVCPFFFWGTSMVAMKGIFPEIGPFAVATFQLIPAGFLLVTYAAKRGVPMPSGRYAWLSIILFALVDGSLVQGFLTEGLQRTSAGLGSAIINCQPLTVAILAGILFGESIGYVGAAGLVLGLVGILLLEVPSLSNQDAPYSLWGSGEWWMLLAAQSMAVGTIMVRWVSKYTDPIMATGWHLVIGGLPIAAISLANKDPIFSGHFDELSYWDISALVYTFVFGGAIGNGLYFYHANKGSLTKLSTLSFLTPIIASFCGYVFLGETLTPLQLVGELVTIVSIYMVNSQSSLK